MRQTLLALMFIPILALAALFGGRLASTHSSQVTSVHPMLECSGLSVPC